MGELKFKNVDSIGIAPKEPQWLNTDVVQEHFDKIKMNKAPGLDG